MTALDEFDRLEAVGTLKRSGDDQGVEVVVTFGEATLTMNALADGSDTPISHWSLAAVDLVEETRAKSIYSLNAETDEVLEIEDETFRQAIKRVLQGRKQIAPPRKSSKKIWGLAGLAALLFGGYLALPGLVAKTAKGMISPERAEVLADEMMPMIEGRTGPACDKDTGLSALETLAQRLNPDGNTAFRVHDLGDAHVISLPGGTVLMNRSIIETADKDLIAAWAAIGIASVIESPAISELFDGQGFLDGIKFLASGQLPVAHKEKAVNRLLTKSGPVNPNILNNAEQLLINGQFSTSGLNKITKGGTAHASAANTIAILSNQDWLDLQSICSG